MTKEKVDVFMMSHSKHFPSLSIGMIKEKLLNLPEDKELTLNSLEFKDTTTMLLISLFVGVFGVDRFMLGDVGMGVLKLLTGGLCGIWWLVDVLGITKKTQQYNFDLLMTLI